MREATDLLSSLVVAHLIMGGDMFDRREVQREREGVISSRGQAFDCDEIRKNSVTINESGERI